MMDNTRAVRVEWEGSGLAFTGRGTLPATPAVRIDGDNGTGPGPMHQLLIAAGGCAAIDVVLILQKMRVKLTGLSVDVSGDRRDTDPKRYETITFRFAASGEGVDRDKLDRAVGLSVEKYCSVVHSLASDIQISYEIDVV